MFFVVPVTFSNMFILNINVFFGIYSFDLIRILLINCVNTCYFTIFCFYVTNCRHIESVSIKRSHLYIDALWVISNFFRL